MRAMRASLATRLGSAAAVAVLATGGAVATATAAGAATGHPAPKAKAVTTLSIKNKVVAHARHHVDVITGVLRAHKTGVAGATITLDGRTGKKPRWVVVATGTTAANGSVSFTVAPTVKSQFKLVFAGSSTLRKSHSNVITVKAVRAPKKKK